jgi:hypothetical protein
MLHHGVASESAKILGHGSSVGNTARSTVTTILDRRSGFTSIASEHRLNQPHPQNSSLSSASEVNRKLSALKARAKNSQVDVDFSLWVYPAQNKQVTAKRVSSIISLSTSRELIYYTRQKFLLHTVPFQPMNQHEVLFSSCY